MYSIGWLENDNMERAHPLFRRGYNNTHPPFLVWSEIPRLKNKTKRKDVVEQILLRGQVVFYSKFL
jgi:hypothetical protein